MDSAALKIKGDVHSDPAVLEKFSKDASSYRILPKLVVEPKSETDIIKTLEFARNQGLNIVGRSGGSGLSGAGIGDGIIVNFKKYLNRVLSVEEETVVQPGAILDSFLKQMSERNFMLPSVPSSSALCALGGNIGTRSTGPRTARYGTIDAFVTSLRFVTPNGEIVDTRNQLPYRFSEKLIRIREDYLSDTGSRGIVAKRPYIAGGYNLNALSAYSDPRDIATHLMVGSIGTLGIITEIRLEPIRHRFSLGTFVAHFRDFDQFVDAAIRLKALDPAALEFADATCSKHVNGKILNLSDPAITQTLMVEFDESAEQAMAGREIIETYDVAEIREVAAGSEEEKALWEDRRRILPSLWKYAGSKEWILPSIIDDVAIHLKDLGPVIKGLNSLMNRLDYQIAYFGHLGFGSIHARPFFDPKGGDLKEQLMTVSREAFNLVKQYNGTLVGEHNAGRSRSVYLEAELGPAYKYLRKIKAIFDPENILNPGALFDTEPIYVNMDLTR